MSCGNTNNMSIVKGVICCSGIALPSENLDSQQLSANIKMILSGSFARAIIDDSVDDVELSIRKDVDVFDLFPFGKMLSRESLRSNTNLFMKKLGFDDFDKDTIDDLISAVETSDDYYFKNSFHAGKESFDTDDYYIEPQNFDAIKFQKLLYNKTLEMVQDGQLTDKDSEISEILKKEKIEPIDYSTLLEMRVIDTQHTDEVKISNGNIYYNENTKTVTVVRSSVFNNINEFFHLRNITAEQWNSNKTKTFSYVYPSQRIRSFFSRNN